MFRWFKLPNPIAKTYIPDILNTMVERFKGLGRKGAATAETKTLNNFCPSRFSQVCPDFPFPQNAYLYSVSRFSAQICVADEKI